MKGMIFQSNDTESPLKFLTNLDKYLVYQMPKLESHNSQMLNEVSRFRVFEIEANNYI